MKKIFIKDIHKPSEKLEIFLFNVGQGDHIMLKFPNMEYGIIDFHYDSINDETPEPPCLSYFKELKDYLGEEFEKVTISFFCFSHTDKDHIKGITEAIDWFDRAGAYIRNIWLGGAINRLQLDNFLTKKLPELFKEHLNLEEQKTHQKVVELFGNNSQEFFDYVEKWKNRKFKSKRYKKGNLYEEYLVENKRLPSPADECEAFNLGPRTSQLSDYLKNLNLDVVKRIFKIKDKTNNVDTNLISHILRLRFREVNMLFGGDTNKKIWKECLEYYDNIGLEKDFGNYDSHFIKVSHHGSKNSSSSIIWEKIVPKSEKVYLGISAGRHNGYNHPHSKTLRDIRDGRSNATIFSTNTCHVCLRKDEILEHHKWYDDFIAKQRNDVEINENLNRNTISTSSADVENEEMGLFAYIFEIPNKLNEKIIVRTALTNTNIPKSCFFHDHQEKLFTHCE